MSGIDIALNHQVAVARHQDYLAEARQHQLIADAYGSNVASRKNSIDIARAAIASVLFRIGAWLMPEKTSEKPIGHGHGLELRPGR